MRLHATVLLGACVVEALLGGGCLAKDNPLWQLSASGGEGTSDASSTASTTTVGITAGGMTTAGPSSSVTTDESTSTSTSTSTMGTLGSTETSTGTMTTAGVDCETGLGSWYHCGGCDTQCGARQACDGAACFTARRVFVTDGSFGAAFGGVAGADAECQQAAATAGLGGEWLAWIFDFGAGFTRYDQASEPFVRLDGVVVANDFNDFFDTTLDQPLSVTQTLQVVSAGTWTGLSSTYGVGFHDCAGWTSSSASCELSAQGTCGGTGSTDQSNPDWAAGGDVSCDQSLRLYCVEQ